jgi:TIR domain
MAVRSTRIEGSWMAGRVFISHAAADRELAQSVCQFLEGQGLGCWLAPRDVPAGSHWAAALMEAIDNSLAMILLLSESSSQSGPVMHEIVQAGSQNKPIFTLKLGPVTLPLAWSSSSPLGTGSISPPCP